MPEPSGGLRAHRADSSRRRGRAHSSARGGDLHRRSLSTALPRLAEHPGERPRRRARRRRTRHLRACVPRLSHSVGFKRSTRGRVGTRRAPRAVARVVLRETSLIARAGEIDPATAGRNAAVLASCGRAALQEAVLIERNAVPVMFKPVADDEAAIGAGIADVEAVIGPLRGPLGVPTPPRASVQSPQTSARSPGARGFARC